jgi:glycerophosphoryl diester phosphodiesterase
MKTYSIFILIVAIGFVAVPSEEALAQNHETKPFFSKSIQFGAHRGGMKWRPESTLGSFRESNALWPDMLVETDARVTKDGVAVLLHDATVNRTTNGTGPVAEMTLEEVQALDAGFDLTFDKGETHPYRGKGYQIPTVVEVLKALPEKHFLIEIKDQPGCAQALVKAIRESNAVDRVCIASFSPAQMKIARELEPGLAMCYAADTIPRLLGALRGDRWEEYVPEADLLIMNYHQLPRYGVTEADFPKLQAKGIPICLYTVNTPEEMNHLLDLGVDGMLTDHPDMLAAVLQERAAR